MSQKLLSAVFEETHKNKTSHFDRYKIDGSDKEVFLSVFPGDTGQVAITDVFVEKESKLEGKEGAIEGFAIGTNESLTGKFLEVYTLVTDVSGDTDKTSFDFQLIGGVKDYKCHMEKTVQEQGDSVIYKITIFFTIH